MGALAAVAELVPRGTGGVVAGQHGGQVVGHLDRARCIVDDPQIIEAGLRRDWAWLAHGRDNSTMQADVPALEERAYLVDVVDTIERAMGRRPLGWMGPGLTETFRTPEMLAELGLEYVLDWTNDDQPYRLNVPGLVSVPYSFELNDITLFVTNGLQGPDLVRIVKDQLDQLVADSADSGRVMALALHPFVTGQAFRHRYLDEALGYVADHPDVWITTSDEIARHFTRENSMSPTGPSR